MSWLRSKIDWIGNGLLIVGMVLIGFKDRDAFIYYFIGEVMWTYYGYKKKEYGLIFISLVFALLAAKNWYMWGS